MTGVVAAILHAELTRRAGDPIKAAVSLRLALVALESTYLEPVAAGWDAHMTLLQARSLLVRALLDAGALMACARVQAAVGQPERRR